MPGNFLICIFIVYLRIFNQVGDEQFPPGKLSHTNFQPKKFLPKIIPILFLLFDDRLFKKSWLFPEHKISGIAIPLYRAKLGYFSLDFYADSK